MRRTHRIILLLIAIVAVATFVFGVLQIIGSRR